MQRQRKEKGMASLLVMLVAVGVALIIASVLIPNVFKLKAVANENNAASQLAAINLAESQYAHYGAFVAPPTLANINLVYPVSCDNPQSIAGQQAVAPAGYVMTFTPGSAAASFTCPAVGSFVAPVGYSTYSINLDPLNNLQAQRHFFSAVGGGADGLVHFNDTRPATAADPVYNVTGTVGTSGGSGSGTGSSAPLAFQGAWEQGATYSAGQIVTYQTSPGSSSAIFLNVTGLNPVAPSQDGVNWSQIGIAQVLQVTYASGSFTPGPTLTTNDFWACQLVGPCMSSSGGSSWSSVISITGTPNPATISAPIFSFSVTNALPGNGAINIVVFQSGNTNQISSACYLPGAGSGVNNGTSAVNPNGNGPCTLAAVIPGEQIVVGFENTGIGGISSYNPGTITWAIQTVGQ
jgi:type II secretory pathway pseudopilin PulG